MVSKRNQLRKAELKEAIYRSILTEKNAMDFYHYASERVYDVQARLTFRLLSREEREHARSFYAAYPDSGLPAFETLMEGLPDPESPWWKALEGARLADFNEHKTLALAIEQEQRLELELRETAEQVADPKIRAVYLANAEATHHHLLAVKDDLRSLD